MTAKKEIASAHAGYEINWEEMAKFQASLEMSPDSIFMIHVSDVDASPLFRRKSDSSWSA